MSFQDEPRFRLNARQTARNLWQLDSTVEYKSDKISRTVNRDDQADLITEPLGLRLLSLIKETERAFRADGRRMVGD